MYGIRFWQKWLCKRNRKLVVKAREGNSPWSSDCDVLNYLSTTDLLNSCSLSTLHTQGCEAEQAELPASEASATNNERTVGQFKRFSFYLN